MTYCAASVSIVQFGVYLRSYYDLISLPGACLLILLLVVALLSV